MEKVGCVGMVCSRSRCRSDVYGELGAEIGVWAVEGGSLGWSEGPGAGPVGADV